MDPEKRRVESLLRSDEACWGSKVLGGWEDEVLKLSVETAVLIDIGSKESLLPEESRLHLQPHLQTGIPAPPVEVAPRKNLILV